MKLVSLLLAASGLACCIGSVHAASDSCDEMYECRFYVEQDSSLYKFDLSPLCSSTGYAFQDTINTVLNDTYNFNICGDSPKKCNPPGSSTYLRYGVAVQSWGPKPAPGTMCPIVGTNEQEECTQECEVLGIDAPEFRLQDVSNAKTGGLIIKHESAPNVLGNRNPCPIDPDTGVELARFATFHIACNPNEVLKWIDAEESPTCSYQMYMESKYACGNVYTGPGSARSRDGLVAGMFFLGLFIGIIAIGAYWFYTKRSGSGSYFNFGSSGAASAPPAVASSTKKSMGSSSYSAVGSA